MGSLTDLSLRASSVYAESGRRTAIRRNDRDAIEFDCAVVGPCNFVCQNSGLRLASLKTEDLPHVYSEGSRRRQKGRVKMIRHVSGRG